MRPLRPLLSVAVLLVACGSTDDGLDPNPMQPRAGAGGAVAAGSSGAAGSPVAGSSGSSSAGSAGTETGQSGASGQAGSGGFAGVSGQAGASGGGQAGATAGVGGSAGAAGASGQGGGAAGQAGQAGAGGQAAGAGGSAAVCKLPDDPVCDCPDPRNVFTTGTPVCEPGSSEPTCDCRFGEAPPATDSVSPCKDFPGGSDPVVAKACVGDDQYPLCYGVLASPKWVDHNCAVPKSGPIKVADGGGNLHPAFCCKAPKP